MSVKNIFKGNRPANFIIEKNTSAKAKTKMARTKQTARKGPLTASQRIALAARQNRLVQEKRATNKRRFRPSTIALREIRKYQKSTDLLIRKLSFARYVFLHTT